MRGREPAWRRAAPALLMVLAACAHHAAAPAGRFSLTLSPASFGQALRLHQIVHVEAPERSINLDAVLDIAPDSLTLVGTTFGLRVLTITFNGSSLQEKRNPLLPADVHGADILTDLQLALWPAPAVRAALPNGWKLADDSVHRTLSHDGHEVTGITYDVAAGSPRWQGTITLHNMLYNYVLTIRPAPEPR